MRSGSQTRRPAVRSNLELRHAFHGQTDRSIKAKGATLRKKESGRTGLGIRITPRGVKTWTFVYRYNGTQKRMVFGTYPKVGVADARIALADAKEMLKHDLDPGKIVAQERQVERDAKTVAALVDEYMKRHANPNMKPTTAAEDERLLRREVLPEWSGRRAKDVSRRDIILLLDGIEDRGVVVTRNRVASVLSRLFLFAMDRGIVDASPAVGGWLNKKGHSQLPEGGLRVGYSALTP